MALEEQISFGSVMLSKRGVGATAEGEPELTLELLNRATQAWVEREYHHKIHSETGQTPLARSHAGTRVVRPCPSSSCEGR